MNNSALGAELLVEAAEAVDDRTVVAELAVLLLQKANQLVALFQGGGNLSVVMFAHEVRVFCTSLLPFAAPQLLASTFLRRRFVTGIYSDARFDAVLDDVWREAG